MDEIREVRNLAGIKKTVEDLNKDFYSLLYDLKENKEACGDPQIYKCMLQNLFNLYKMEYKRIYVEYELKYNREVFEKEEKLASLTPHAWRFLCFHHENIPAKLIIEDVDIKSEKFFKECERLNDTARPPYMAKLWLTRADKKEARRAERRTRKAAKRANKEAKKEAAKLARQLAKENRRQKKLKRKNKSLSPSSAIPSSTVPIQISDAEAKKQARLRALEERRRQQREQQSAATSPKSPKTGT